VVVIAASGEATEAGVHALEVVLGLLDLPADAAEQHVLLGEDGAELAQEDPQDALRGAHHGGLHDERGDALLVAGSVISPSFGCIT